MTRLGGAVHVGETRFAGQSLLAPGIRIAAVGALGVAVRVRPAAAAIAVDAERRPRSWTIVVDATSRIALGISLAAADAVAPASTVRIGETRRLHAPPPARVTLRQEGMRAVGIDPAVLTRTILAYG